MNQPIRVLLVDDHSIVRFGYQQLLVQGGRIEVIAEAENCAEALAHYRDCTPDVVILDLSMPIDNESSDVQSTAGGLEAIRRIRSYDEKAAILVVSGLESTPYPQRAAQAGAQGYVSKRNASSELEQAVVKVARGETFYSSSIAPLLDSKAQPDDTQKLSQLTGREVEIFSMLAEGLSVNAIADVVHLSPKTVHAHRANLLRKLNLTSTSDIIHLAMRAGIIQT